MIRSMVKCIGCVFTTAIDEVVWRPVGVTKLTLLEFCRLEDNKTVEDWRSCFETILTQLLSGVEHLD